ncbi:MAG: hypothetical protein ACE5GZ_01785 [Gammaproteobacteria bacterium]
MGASSLIALQMTSDSSKSNSSVQSEGNRHGIQPFGEDGVTFGDLIDIINPLQHIPIISSFYRRLTGDRIDPAARIAGGALFGGPIGIAVAIANTVAEQVNGKDIGAQVLALIKGNGGGPKQERVIAGRQLAFGQVDISKDKTAHMDGSGLNRPASDNIPELHRGGWIVNAAYRGRDSYLPARIPVRSVQAAASRVGAAPSNNSPDRYPGGWIINAAYRGRDSYLHTPASVKTGAARVDIAA